MMCPESDFLPGPTVAYVGLGSNMGDGPSALSAARETVAALPGVRIVSASSLYLTEPQGVSEQPFFTNQVVELACDPGLRAGTLLDMLLDEENSLGRVRGGGLRFGPRPIDLDLLLFGNEVMNTERLALPHPRMLERAFVLVPLAEIAPDLVLPHGLNVTEALGRLDYRQEDDVLYQGGGIDAAPL